MPLLLTVPGIGWVLAFTIAAEIGDITRFPSARKLTGYTGLCPRVRQSGEKDRRGPLTKQGPKYLRWALLEATMHALRHPAYRERYQRTKHRLGKQRGAKVAQIDIARKLDRGDLAHAHHQPAVRPASCCGRRHSSSDRLTVLLELRPRSRPPMSPSPPRGSYREMSAAPTPTSSVPISPAIHDRRATPSAHTPLHHKHNT